MPLFLTLIDNLHPLVTSSVIKVRCIRVYDVAMPGKKEIISLDCGLHDRKVIVNSGAVEFKDFEKRPKMNCEVLWEEVTEECKFSMVMIW
ncbi:hypothetical protein SASPL_108609 [Salvia splendens]|uniref:Uncharacterized protein n=1 Tax=Salvia splendens TaxID=180675 RepID=A0A8X8YFL9_SALSN|nr:hypothetical protein SASPL_108609 [Salvia splendens]